MFSTSAGGSWLICGLLLMMNAFTACLETASNTKWLKQQNLTEYMDAVEVAICLGCHSPRFLAELSDFWKQPQHLLQEGVPDQSCSCTKHWSGAGAGQGSSSGSRWQGLTWAGRTCPASHFTGSLLVSSQHCPLSLSCSIWPSAKQEQKYEANELEGLQGDVVALCESELSF